MNISQNNNMYPSDQTTSDLFNTFIEYFNESIWPSLFPYFFWLNALGVVAVVFMYIKFLDAKKKIKEIDDADVKKVDELFKWVNDKPKTNPRWEKIESLSRSSSQSDWKMAILEADSMLDELTKSLGVSGDNMGERMLNLNTSVFPFLDEAWRVHKLRNIIAHETSYDLQRGEMEDAIDGYSLIFKSMNFV